MIYFITGPVGSGKSGRLIAMYNKIGCGDGFYNRRVYENGLCVGQELVNVKSGGSAFFSRVIGFIPKGWDEACRYQNYSFSRNGIAFAEKIIDEALKTKAPAFVDEIGPLELCGRGLYNSFLKLLDSNKDIYAVVRESSLDEVSAKFKIKEYTITK